MKNINPEELSQQIRISCLKMTNKANSSHIGSMFSCADIISTLYTRIMRYDFKNPNDENRDYFLQSKGHAGAALYAALSKIGFLTR